MNNEYIDDPTERPYHVKCALKFYRKTVHDNIGRGKNQTYERTLVLLVPQESDERTRLFLAWLPETAGEHYEMAAYIGHPVHAPARLSIHRRDEKCQEHYLFCMSVGAEEVLTKCKEGQMIDVKTLPASADSEADAARDPNHKFEVIQ